jgi:hypothetical protein
VPLVLVQKDLDRSCEWCRSNRFDLNAGKCKLISFCRSLRTTEFVYSINETALGRVDEIKDLGGIIYVYLDGRMSFLIHIKAINFKSSRMLSFIKRRSREFHKPYTHKTVHFYYEFRSCHLRLVASLVCSFGVAGASAAQSHSLCITSTAVESLIDARLL